MNLTEESQRIRLPISGQAGPVEGGSNPLDDGELLCGMKSEVVDLSRQLRTRKRLAKVLAEGKKGKLSRRYRETYERHEEEQVPFHHDDVPLNLLGIVASRVSLAFSDNWAVKVLSAGLPFMMNAPIISATLKTLPGTSQWSQKERNTASLTLKRTLATASTLALCFLGVRGFRADVPVDASRMLTVKALVDSLSLWVGDVLQKRLSHRQQSEKRELLTDLEECNHKDSLVMDVSRKMEQCMADILRTARKFKFVHSLEMRG